MKCAPSKSERFHNLLNPPIPMLLLQCSDKEDSESRLARTWFAEVRKRKGLINCAENKLLVELILYSRHPSERIMVFSETIESIQKLREILLKNNGINSMIIDSSLKINEREKILSVWGKDFFPLLSVHTLEVGYDVPEVSIAIILATTSNMNPDSTKNR